MSDENSSGKKWSQQNIMIMILLGVVIVLLAANLFKSPSVQVIETATDDVPAAKSKGERGREEDPYIANQVKNTIVKGYIPVRDCYNAFVATNPPVTDGKVMIDWTIKENGSVEKVELVSSEIPAEGLTSCMINEIQKFKFPTPPNGKPKYVAHKFFFKKETGNEAAVPETKQKVK